ncbi:thioredoxin family protein [Aestuariivivens sediminis]|uniref:thioredoxin family protein n=1 Tax=Aestuariivivens sediminis TaxID=2913557 RepID=UPI001F5918E5|nr:thioredoxin family protein [Aestuariivivens sediminis]
MDALLAKSLGKSMSYETYRELVRQLAIDNSTSGLQKTESNIQFTKLNDRRMKRWDKTIELSEETIERINSFQEKVTWLVISESWCGDSAHINPVLNKIAQINNNIDLRFVLRDENPELMDAFLTYGNRSIPKLIMIDDASGKVLSTYGPRPSEATYFVNRFISKNGKLTPDFKEDLQHWYNKDKGKNILDDITEMLCETSSNFCL